MFLWCCVRSNNFSSHVTWETFFVTAFKLLGHPSQSLHWFDHFSQKWLSSVWNYQRSPASLVGRRRLLLKFQPHHFKAERTCYCLDLSEVGFTVGLPLQVTLGHDLLDRLLLQELTPDLVEDISDPGLLGSRIEDRGSRMECSRIQDQVAWRARATWKKGDWCRILGVTVHCYGIKRLKRPKRNLLDSWTPVARLSLPIQWMWMFCRAWFEFNVKGNERKPGNWSIFKRRYHCALLLPLWCCKKKDKCTPPTPTPSLLICIFSKPEMGCTAQWQLKWKEKANISNN